MSREGHDNITGMNSDMPGMGGDMPGMGGDLGMYILAFLFVLLLAVAAEVLSALPIIRAGTNPTKAGAIQAGIYAFRICFVYLIMLAVMSFNIGIFIAAVAGHSLGFFLIKARTQALANQAAVKVCSLNPSNSALETTHHLTTDPLLKT